MLSKMDDFFFFWGGGGPPVFQARLTKMAMKFLFSMLSLALVDLILQQFSIYMFMAIFFYFLAYRIVPVLVHIAVCIPSSSILYLCM